MKVEDIFTEVRNQIENIKRKGRVPGSVIVSKEIFYDIQADMFSKKDYSYPFFPDYTQASEIRYDKLFGLPIAIINTNYKNFIQVYTKG